jgi:hypothetical protein
MENFAISVADPYRFAACMLLLRPNIKNKFLKDLRAKLMERIEPYICEQNVDNMPKYPAPLSNKQVEAVVDRFFADIHKYVYLYHLCGWYMTTEIVEELESVARAGSRIRSELRSQAEHDSWKNNY